MRTVLSQRRSCRRTTIASVFASALFASAGGVSADDHAHALHFSHPIATESPSPDTKLRVDYLFEDLSGGVSGERHTIRLEGEYAFAKWISLEFDLPYVVVDPHGASRRDRIGNMEVALKLASLRMAEHGLLLGGGLELGLPTGNEAVGIGSDEVVEIEPFIDFGWKRDALEVIGFLAPGIPVNDDGEADVELGWNLSALWHLTETIELLAEIEGEHALGGAEDGESAVSIGPGIKLAPIRSHPALKLGVGVSFPVTDDKAFDPRVTSSLFHHF